jgi:hypothetical protein
MKDQEVKKLIDNSPLKRLSLTRTQIKKFKKIMDKPLPIKIKQP